MNRTIYTLTTTTTTTSSTIETVPNKKIIKSRHCYYHPTVKIKGQKQIQELGREKKQALQRKMDDSSSSSSSSSSQFRISRSGNR